MGKIVQKGISYGGGGNVKVDAELNAASENPVQNKVVTEALDGKVNTDDVMIGAKSNADGQSGLVPAPAAGAESMYLRGDGQWGRVTPAFVLDGQIVINGNDSSTIGGSGENFYLVKAVYQTIPVIDLWLMRSWGTGGQLDVTKLNSGDSSSYYTIQRTDDMLLTITNKMGNTMVVTTYRISI